MAKNLRQKVEHAKGAGKAFIGVEVSWQFGRGPKDATAVSIERTRVRDAFGPFGDFVPDLELEEIVKRSMHRKWNRALGLKTKVRPEEMPKHNADTPAAWGLYYTVPIQGESGDDQACGARVRIEAGRAVCLPPEGVVSFTSEQEVQDCKRYGDAVADWINERIINAVNHDISDALASLCRRLGGMPRHPNGGVYFMPPTERTDQFLEVLERLQQLTEDRRSENQFFSDPAMQFADPRDADDINARTFSRVVVHGIEAEIGRLEKELKQMVERNARDNTWVKKQAECAELMARAENFALILADKLDSIKQSAEVMRQKFGSAAEAAAKVKAEAAVAFAGTKQNKRKSKAKPAAEPAPKPEPAPAPKVEPKPEEKPLGAFTQADIDALFGG
jgi:hypothetical protein